MILRVLSEVGTSDSSCQASEYRPLLDFRVSLERRAVATYEVLLRF